MSLERLLREAGEILKVGYKDVFESDFKSQSELVTKYDIAVEEFLTPRLQEMYEDLEIVGEESFKGDFYPQNGVFIDPIDGTTNFVHKIPFFAISVGVFKDDMAYECGLYNPILDEFYYAKKGEGAFKNGVKMSVSKTSTLEKSLIATGFPYTKNSSKNDLNFVLKSMSNLLPCIRDIRRLGAASVDLALVAEGKMDGFYEINLKPWDVASGILLIEEAGGVVSSKNAPFDMNSRVIVASNGAIHKELSDKIASIGVPS